MNQSINQSINHRRTTSFHLNVVSARNSRRQLAVFECQEELRGGEGMLVWLGVARPTALAFRPLDSIYDNEESLDVDEISELGRSYLMEEALGFGGEAGLRF